MYTLFVKCDARANLAFPNNRQLPTKLRQLLCFSFAKKDVFRETINTCFMYTLLVKCDARANLAFPNNRQLPTKLQPVATKLQPVATKLHNTTSCCFFFCNRGKAVFATFAKVGIPCVGVLDFHNKR